MPAPRSLARCWERADWLRPTASTSAPTGRSPSTSWHRIASRFTLASAARRRVASAAFAASSFASWIRKVNFPVQSPTYISARYILECTNLAMPKLKARHCRPDRCVVASGLTEAFCFLTSRPVASRHVARKRFSITFRESRDPLLPERVRNDPKRSIRCSARCHQIVSASPCIVSFAVTIPPEGTEPNCGFACHTVAASKDYIFTQYPRR